MRSILVGFFGFLFNVSIFCCDFYCQPDTVIDVDTLDFYHFLENKVNGSLNVYSGYFTFTDFVVRDTIPADSINSSYVRYWKIGKFIVTNKYKGLNIPDVFTWNYGTCAKLDSINYLCSTTDCDGLVAHFNTGNFIAFSESINDSKPPDFYYWDTEYFCGDRRKYRKWFEIKNDSIVYRQDAISLLVFQNMIKNISVEIPSLKSNQFFFTVVPNPFNPSTSINYSMPDKQKGLLNIYSSNGALILNREIQGCGKFNWNAGSKASGLYLCRLNTEKNSYARKILLMH